MSGRGHLSLPSLPHGRGQTRRAESALTSLLGPEHPANPGQVQITLPTPASTSVLSSQGVPPALPSPAAGEGQGQLFHCHDPGTLARLLYVPRSLGEGRSLPCSRPPHAKQIVGPVITSSSPPSQLLCSLADRVSSTVLPR